MAKQFFIIDGYNLLHAAGLARQRYAPHQLEKQRNRLITFVAHHLTDDERRMTTIVFDAFDAPSDADRHHRFDSMRVLFAPPGTDADSEIERLIQKHSAPRQVCIVSGDRRLQIAAKRRRARFVGSEQYFARLEQRGHFPSDERAPAHAKFTGDLSEDEVRVWLEAFGEDAVDAVIEDERQAKRRAVPMPAASTPKRQRRHTPRSQPKADKPEKPRGSAHLNKTQRRQVSSTPELPEKNVADVTADELEEWLQAFGDLPELEEIRRLGTSPQSERDDTQ